VTHPGSSDLYIRSPQSARHSWHPRRSSCSLCQKHHFWIQGRCQDQGRHLCSCDPLGRHSAARRKGPISLRLRHGLRRKDSQRRKVTVGSACKPEFVGMLTSIATWSPTRLHRSWTMPRVICSRLTRLLECFVKRRSQQCQSIPLCCQVYDQEISDVFRSLQSRWDTRCVVDYCQRALASIVAYGATFQITFRLSKMPQRFVWLCSHEVKMIWKTEESRIW
jgi:hypothetical protein